MFKVAFCGPDGAGKTTLLKAIGEQSTDSSVAIIPRGPAHAERIAESAFPGTHGDYRDWLEGEFADGISVACAFDSAIYIKEMVQGLLERPAPPRMALFDRFTTCFLAYNDCLKTPSALAERLLISIPHPDLVFFVTADWPVIEQRKSKRNTYNPFEDIGAQRIFADAYLRIFERYGIPYVQLDNSGDIRRTLSRIDAETAQRFGMSIFHLPKDMSHES